jgi:hypothetical protein
MKPQTKNDENTARPLKRKKGETLQEKVQRHIKDKNDIITDEDIRDAVMGTITPAQQEDSEEFADELEKKKKITTWEILDEYE